MAQEVVIRLQVEGDADINQLKKELDSTAKSFQKVEKEADQTKNKLQEVGENGGAIAVLDSLTGGLATRVRDAAEATKVLNFSLKGTRTALIATGIGAFVVAVGLLVAYWEDIAKFVNGTNVELEKQQRILNKQAERRTVELDLLRAQEGSLKRKGETQLQYNNRLIKELELLIDVQEKELEIAENRLKELEDLRSVGGSTIEGFAKIGLSAIITLGEQVDKFFKKLGFDTDFGSAAAGTVDSIIETIFGSKEDLNEAQIRVDELKLSIASARSEIAGLKDENDAIAFGNREKDKPLPILRAEEIAQAEIEIGEARVLNAQYVQNAITEAEEANAIARRKIAELEAQAKIEALTRTGQALSEVGNILGDATAAGKAAALAGALISVYQGIANVWAEKAESGLVGAGLIQRIATTAIVAAQGFGTVKKILGVKVPKGGAIGGGASIPGGASGGAAIAQPTFNVIGNTGINQLNDAINERTNEPVKAYVTMSDISRGQSIERNTISEASVG